MADVILCPVIEGVDAFFAELNLLSGFWGKGPVMCNISRVSVSIEIVELLPGDDTGSWCSWIFNTIIDVSPEKIFESCSTGMTISSGDGEVGEAFEVPRNIAYSLVSMIWELDHGGWWCVVNVEGTGLRYASLTGQVKRHVSI